VKISAILPPKDVQQSFLPREYYDRTFRCMAQTRVHCGAFYEEATCNLFQADRHVIDSTADICPDLSLGKGQYLEVKSVGLSRQSLIYSNRLAHDRDLVNYTKGTLHYVFWIHNVEAAKCHSLHVLRDELARNVEEILVVPFDQLEQACQSIPAQIMNYRAARSDGRAAQPMPGRRLSYRLLKELAGNTERARALSAPVYSILPLPQRMRQFAHNA